MPAPSVPPRLAEEALRPLYAAILNDRLPVRMQRRMLDAASVVQPVVRGVGRERVALGGRAADRFDRTRTTASDKGAPRVPAAVLYLHGGGFTIGSPRTHRPVTARIARDTGASVFSLDYRLAPEHPYPAAVDDAAAAFRELIDQRGFAPGSVAIAGDSAGGGIAAAVTRRILDSGRPAPAAAVLIAPAVDPSAHIGDMTDDAVLRSTWVRSVCEAYRGDTPPDDPGFAPLHASASGFPPTLVQIGSRERMLDEQVRAYADHLRSAGVDATLAVSDGLWHVAQLQSGFVRHAAASCDRICAFLRTHLP